MIFNNSDDDLTTVMMMSDNNDVMTKRRMVVISTKANNDGVNGGEDTDANDEKGTRCDAAKTRLTIVSSFNEVNNN